jgi:hypothetical protein
MLKGIAMPESEKNKNTEQDNKAQGPIERRLEELTAARNGNPYPASAPDLPPPGTSETIPGSPAADEIFQPEVNNPDDSAPDAVDASTGSPLDDELVDPLVDDIISNEGNELLAARDAEIARAFTAERPGLKDRVAAMARSWWNNKLARYGTLAGLVIVVTVAGIVPDSRYYLMNTAGVRATASLTILDSTNDLPLKNVLVTVPGQTARTNADGVIRLHHLKLGPQALTIERLGFAKVERTVTFGLGSNPLGDIALKAVGLQYKFQLTDYLTGNAIKNAEISNGEDVSAQSDNDGDVVLTIGKLSDKPFDVSVAAVGYRTEKLSIDPAKKSVTQLALVSDRKHVFVSKQSGKYDLYKVDTDGKNKQVLLPGTGIENDRLALVTGPGGKKVALVSTRENKRNQDGFLLQTLTIIDIEDGDALTLDHSERIQLVGWVKDRLVYVKVKAGTSAGNPERHQLISYNVETSSRLQLAAANYFTDVMIAKGVVYYAASNNYQGGQSQFASINPDNSGKQVLVNEPVWNIARSSYDDLNLSGNDLWFAYKLGDTSAKKLATPPGNNEETRFYLDAADGGQALWTDSRDGKGVLLTYDPASKKDKTLTTQSGLTYPLRWLDGGTVVYRIATPHETADYILSMDGGTPRKIADVTNASGLGTWFYY